MNRLDDFEPLRESTRQERNLCLLFILIFSGTWTKKGTPAELAKVEILGIFLNKEDPAWFLTSLILCFMMLTTAFAINLRIDSRFHRMHRMHRMYRMDRMDTDPNQNVREANDVRDINLNISLYLYSHWVLVCVGYFKVCEGLWILKKITNHP